MLIGMLALLWGCNWPVLKVGVTELAPLTFRAASLPFAGIGLLILAKLGGDSIAIPRALWPKVAALAGDLNPKWVEVWAHLTLGKIFDVTGQRDRALNEYQRALQTNDNTQGALDEANQHVQKPYSEASRQIS